MSQTEVLMPSMGEGVHEATLVKWLKKAGDKVAHNEPLLEVSTDKVDTEIPAPRPGYVTSLRVKEGAVVKVDQVLAIISDSQDATDARAFESQAKESQAKESQAKPVAPIPDQPPKGDPSIAKAKLSPVQHEQKTTPKPVVQIRANDGRVKSSPLVRKIAREQGLNLAEITGTGMAGRITRRDLEEHLKSLTLSAMTIKAPGSDRRTDLGPIELGLPKSSSESVKSHRLNTTVVQGKEYLDGVLVERQKMSRMRSLIADHMVESVRVSPHVTTVFEVDLNKVVKIRERYKAEFQNKEGFNLTYTHFLVHAAVAALGKHPLLNTSIDGDEILFKKDLNIGCAVAIEGGLIVPVLKNAGELSLLGVARGLNDLVVRANSKKLKPDEVKGGTFSITNPGGFGCITSNPIINQPQVAILGIGAIVKRPVVIDDAIAIRPMMMISLTFDHRVVDGEGGARYLADLKKILETYEELPI